MGAVWTEIAEADEKVTPSRISPLRDQFDRFQCNYPVVVCRNGCKLYKVCSIIRTTLIR